MYSPKDGLNQVSDILGDIHETDAIASMRTINPQSHCSELLGMGDPLEPTLSDFRALLHF